MMSVACSVKAVYDRLQDEESRLLFMTNLGYFLTGEERYWQEMMETAILFALRRERKYPEKLLPLEDFMREPDYRKKKVVLFGAGYYCRLLFPVLKRFNINICAICDKNKDKQETELFGYTIISPEELLLNYKDCYIIPTVQINGSIVNYLLEQGIPEKRIVSLFKTKEMYFAPDFIKPVKNEVYIDAGAYNTTTIIQFIRFCNDDGLSYKKILAFEPDISNYKKLVSKLSDSKYADIEVLNKGLWSASATLCFIAEDFPQASRIDETGDNTIETVTIDECVKGEKVTFIKMDIEGAEQEALKGAARTIREHKPRLAVSVYHKPEDFIDIPVYILSLNPEYRLWLRRHTYIGTEFVLYAVMP